MTKFPKMNNNKPNFTHIRGKKEIKAYSHLKQINMSTIKGENCFHKSLVSDLTEIYENFIKLSCSWSNDELIFEYLIKYNDFLYSKFHQKTLSKIIETIKEFCIEKTNSLNNEYLNLKSSPYVKFLLKFVQDEVNNKKNRKHWENKLQILESILNGLNFKKTMGIDIGEIPKKKIKINSNELEEKKEPEAQARMND